MAGIDLSKQVGPLPLGAWVVVVGAGLGIAYTSRNSGGGSAAPAGDEFVEDIGTDPGVGEGPGWVAVPPPTTSPVATTPTTNEEWANRAIDFMIGNGYPPDVTYSGITKAINSGGEGMSVSEYAIWRAALRSMGAPPTPVDVPIPTPSAISGGGGGITTDPLPEPYEPLPTAPPPAPPAAPPRARDSYWTIKKGDTLRDISLRFYGVERGWDNIKRNNKFLPGNHGGNEPLNKWAGRRLLIPAYGAGGEYPSRG